jgi:plasmid stabilization system protein ParE
MSLPLVIRPAAQAELDDAASWYDRQKLGLGADLIDEVQKVLDTIVNQPDRYPITSGDIREAAVRKFPYCVYYRVGQSRIAVLAVFHTSRDPAIWQSRA